MARHPEIYNTNEWEKARAFVIERANGLCEPCLKKGKIHAGKIVDHIIPLTDENKHDWNITYDPNNLHYVCIAYHTEKHYGTSGLENFLTPPG